MKKIFLIFILLTGCYNTEELQSVEYDSDTSMDSVPEINTDTGLPTVWEIQQRFCDAMYDCGGKDCVRTAILVDNCDTEDHYFKMCARAIDAIICDQSVLIPQDCQQACQR